MTWYAFVLIEVFTVSVITSLDLIAHLLPILLLTFSIMLIKTQIKKLGDIKPREQLLHVNLGLFISYYILIFVQRIIETRTDDFDTNATHYCYVTVVSGIVSPARVILIGAILVLFIYMSTLFSKEVPAQNLLVSTQHGQS